VAVFYSNDSTYLSGIVLDWDGSALTVFAVTTQLKNRASASIEARILSGGATPLIAITASSYLYVVKWSGSLLTLENEAGFGVSSGYIPLCTLNDTTIVAFRDDGTQSPASPVLFIFYKGSLPDPLIKLTSFNATATAINVESYANSIVSLDSERVAVFFLAGDNNLFMQIYKIVAMSSARSDLSIEKVSEKRFSRYFNTYAPLSKSGDNRLLVGYRDGENSGYGTVEKVDIDL